MTGCQESLPQTCGHKICHRNHKTLEKNLPYKFTGRSRVWTKRGEEAFNANAKKEEDNCIEETILYGANNIDEPYSVHAEKIFHAGKKVGGGIGGVFARNVRHLFVRYGINSLCD